MLLGRCHTGLDGRETSRWHNLMTGIAPAATMVTWLASFTARFDKAQAALLIHTRMAGMGCSGLQDDWNRPQQ